MDLIQSEFPNSIGHQEDFHHLNIKKRCRVGDLERETRVYATLETGVDGPSRIPHNLCGGKATWIIEIKV